MCNVSQDAHCLSVHSSLIVIPLFIMTLAFFLLSLSNFREILIGFVIASVCTCFISRVLNDRRVNVGHLNELHRQCLVFIYPGYMPPSVAVEKSQNSCSGFQVCNSFILRFWLAWFYYLFWLDCWELFFFPMKTTLNQTLCFRFSSDTKHNFFIEEDIKLLNEIDVAV